MGIPKTRGNSSGLFSPQSTSTTISNGSKKKKKRQKPHCFICRDNINSRQHWLLCSQCKMNFHRTCLPKISHAKFFKLKEEAWNCESCINNINSCRICNAPMPNSVCSSCGVMPMLDESLDESYGKSETGSTNLQSEIDFESTRVKSMGI